MPNHRLLLFCLLAACLPGARPAVAQKAPELGYAFPPAVKRGNKTTVQLGGYDFTPDTQFFVHDARIKLTIKSSLSDFIVPPPPYWFGERARDAAFPIPREFTAVIEVPADIMPGLQRWQAANANGSSTTATLFVSDIEEIIEKRIQKRPQLIKRLPVGISGRLGRIAEVDVYRIKAKNDGPITVELFARRLGANFNGMLTIRDRSGQLLAESADTEGVDTSVTFAANRGSTYDIRIHDLSFRGNQAFVYRLAVTAGPRIVATVPAAGQRGKTTEVELIGYGVATGGPQLESTRRKIQFPATAKRSFHSFYLPPSNGRRPSVDIPLSDLPEFRDTSSQATMHVKAPAAVTTILNGRPRVFSWSAKKGQVWSIAAQSRAFGSRVDPSVLIRNADGKELARNDDAGGTPDAELQFKVPADGAYECVVEDVSGQTPGATSICRVAWKLEPAAFALTMPQQINLPTPGKVAVQLKVVRRGGFQGEIDVSIEGLPAGISAPAELKVPAGKNILKFSLTAGPQTAAQAGLMRIRGTAEVGDARITRTATATAAGNLCPRRESDQWVTGVMLATTLKPRFSLDLVDQNRQRSVHRGTTYPAPFLIQRQKGFQGQLQIQMAARQGRHRQGISGPIMTVPQDAKQASYPCFMPEWLETDRTTRMAVMGVARQLDPAGKPRYVTKPAGARVTMILEGALLKLSHQASELTVLPGEVFRVPIRVSRSTKLRRPVEVTLIVPASLRGLLRIRSGHELPANRSQSELLIETVKTNRLSGRWTVVLRATSKQDGLWPVVSQTSLTVQFSTATSQ